MKRLFQRHERTQYFIDTHDQTLSVAVRVRDPDGEADRVRLEAQLRALPPPPSTTEEVLNPIWDAAGDIRKKIAERFPELQRDSRW